MKIHTNGTLNNQQKKGCLVVIPKHFLCKDLVHHPIETTIKKWLFGYTQRFELVGFLCNFVWFTLGNYTEGMSTFVFAICSCVVENIKDIERNTVTE